MQRIENAESSMKRILKFAQELSEQNQKQYERTRERLRELIQMCNDTIEILSPIASVPVPVSICDNTSCFSASCADDTSQFSASTSGSYYETETTSHDSNIQSESIQQVCQSEQSQSVSETTNLPSFASINHLYAETLHKLASDHDMPVAVQDCAKMLYRWFDKRILKAASYKPYNRLKLHPKFYPNLIRDLIITYGYYLENHRIYDFYSEFNEFIDKLGFDKTVTETYSVPMSTFKLGQHTDQYATISALVIMDYFWQHGLSALNLDNTVNQCASLHDFVVFDAFENSDSDEINAYVSNPHQYDSYIANLYPAGSDTIC